MAIVISTKAIFDSVHQPNVMLESENQATNNLPTCQSIKTLKVAMKTTKCVFGQTLKGFRRTNFSKLNFGPKKGNPEKNRI